MDRSLCVEYVDVVLKENGECLWCVRAVERWRVELRIIFIILFNFT